MEIAPMKRDWGQVFAKGYGEEGMICEYHYGFLLPSSDCRRNTCSLNYKILEKQYEIIQKGKSLSEISTSDDKTIRIMGYFPVYFYIQTNYICYLPILYNQDPTLCTFFLVSAFSSLLW